MGEKAPNLLTLMVALGQNYLMRKSLLRSRETFERLF
jgi:hypothetical protein